MIFQFSGIDVRKLLFLISGILLYMSADKLSKNSAFHYISGICFGVCASFLILIYLLSKMFPKVINISVIC